jgi:uncharacterized protein YdhG (YjbR/CyaY superfamily)
MEKEKEAGKTVEEYIRRYPPEVQAKLAALRATIRSAAPAAQEKISYGMPAYMLNGPLLYFGAFKSHIGFYPTAEGIETFKEELKGYKNSKGTVQFPMDKPLPLELITRIVKHRVEENLKK